MPWRNQRTCCGITSSSSGTLHPFVKGNHGGKTSITCSRTPRLGGYGLRRLCSGITRLLLNRAAVGTLSEPSVSMHMQGVVSETIRLCGGCLAIMHCAWAQDPAAGVTVLNRTERLLEIDSYRPLDWSSIHPQRLITESKSVPKILHFAVLMTSSTRIPAESFRLLQTTPTCRKAAALKSDSLSIQTDIRPMSLRYWIV